MKPVRAAAIVLTATMALLGAACGDDGGDDGDAAATTAGAGTSVEAFSVSSSNTGSSARTARRQLEVPWVPGRAVQVRLGKRDRSELGSVRLADDHEPGLSEPADDGGVVVGDEICVRAGGECRSNPRGRGEILHCDRHASKRGIAVRLVYGARLRERVVSPESDEGVELRIEASDSLEVKLHQLHGGDLSGPNEPRLLDG